MIGTYDLHLAQAFSGLGLMLLGLGIYTVSDGLLRVGCLVLLRLALVLDCVDLVQDGAHSVITLKQLLICARHDTLLALLLTTEHRVDRLLLRACDTRRPTTSTSSDSCCSRRPLAEAQGVGPTLAEHLRRGQAAKTLTVEHLTLA